VEGEGGEVVTR